MVLGSTESRPTGVFDGLMDGESAMGKEEAGSEHSTFNDEKQLAGDSEPYQPMGQG